jgi:hypothetical protein
MVMRRHWRIALPLFALLALALSVAPASAALAVTAVTAVKWNVTPAANYTVTNNGAQPLLRFNDCLRPDTTYTIPVAVTVEGTGSYSATFATVGEATQFLSSVSFAPISINGADTNTFNTTVTIRTGSRAVAEPTAPPPNRFGVYLEPSPGATPLAESFLTIDLRCISSATPSTPGLPNTGAGGMATDKDIAPTLAVGLVAALLVGGGYGLRRRMTR